MYDAIATSHFNMRAKRDFMDGTLKWVLPIKIGKSFLLQDCTKFSAVVCIETLL
jgi:hypothetical protein